MLIGKASYKKCPHCKKPNEYHNGPFHIHYYGKHEWSDGETFSELPNLEYNRLQKCNSCNQYYWYSGKLRGYGLEHHLEAIKIFDNKYSKKSILNFITSKRNKKRLIYIRKRILGSLNDKIRTRHPLSEERNYISGGVKIRRTFTEEENSLFVENIKALLKLLIEIKSKDYLLLSELYRNLGDFDRAKNYALKSSSKVIVKQMLREIELGNTEVFKIEMNNLDF